MLARVERALGEQNASALIIDTWAPRPEERTTTALVAEARAEIAAASAL